MKKTNQLFLNHSIRMLFALILLNSKTYAHDIFDQIHYFQLCLQYKHFQSLHNHPYLKEVLHLLINHEDQNYEQNNALQQYYLLSLFQIKIFWQIIH